jgi:hypothetical protein
LAHGDDREAAEAQAERVASTYRSPQDHIPRPSLFTAYFHAMKVTGRDAERSHNLDLKKLAIQQGFKALNAAGFTKIDTSLTGDKQEHRRVLPFSKDTLPHVQLALIIVLSSWVSYLPYSLIYPKRSLPRDGSVVHGGVSESIKSVGPEQV